jgi:hypothetical protein
VGKRDEKKGESERWWAVAGVMALLFEGEGESLGTLIARMVCWNGRPAKTVAVFRV